MSISEIRCYHNCCLERKFFDSLPIDHIFVYATLGPTNTMYAAIGYCILKENHTLTPSSVRNKFNEIAPELSPIRVFLKGEEKPKYWESLNALAFKYEIEAENGEEKEIISSFYLALCKKCGFESKNIREIKVLRKDEDKTEEVVFLKSLDVKLIEKAIEQLKSIDIKFIEETTKQLKSINVYERIHWKRDVAKEYNEEKTPINELGRLGFSTFRQKKQVDLLDFFHVFFPAAYSTGLLRKKIEEIESRDPEKLLEEQYERIKRELISIRTMIKDKDDRENYLDVFADIETHRISYRGSLEKSRKTPHNLITQAALSNTLCDFRRSLLEAEYFLERRRI